MHCNQRFRSIALIGLVGIFLGSCTVSFAGDGDARLRKRVAELEAENRSLRKIIAGVQGLLKSVPKSSVPAATNSSGLRIVVFPGEWAGSGLADIRKVCESAGKSLTAQLPDDGFAPIFVYRNKTGPITLFRRGTGNEYIVRVNTGGRKWAQLAFQFSHEFCHIVCNHRNAKNPQLWFEETLCECASLYSLRRMAVEWKTNPPYSNWKNYSKSLASYADDRMKKYAGRKESIVKFYQTNKTAIEKTGTNRELNTNIAIKLLPLFEATPQAWQSLRYLNLGPAKENLSFKAYLTGWHNRVPAKHRPFIQQIATKFGLKLTNAKQPD
jgi:hypothetical protein